MSFHFSSSFHLCLLIFIFLIKTNNFEEIRGTEIRDISKLVDYSIRGLGKPVKGKLDIKTLMPKIPKHIQVYLAVAFSEKDFPSYSKIFNKTLSAIPNSFLISDSLNRHYNVSVSPLFFVLPNSGRFSSSIYEVMCNSFDGKRVIAILVIGESPAAFTVSLTAVTSNIPVLWARGVIPSPPGSVQQQDPLEIRLEPGEIQLLEAVRGVFLATHWHSFTVMAAPSLAARCASILDLPPLNPKVVPITRNPHNIFRKMADVSRSTRGVVLLLCDLTDATLVMKVAKKLSMIDGHFVWIWIDTTTKPASFLTVPVGPHQKYTRYLDKTSKAKTLKGASFYQKDGLIEEFKVNFDKKTKSKEEKFNKSHKKIIKRDTLAKVGAVRDEAKARKTNKFMSSQAKVLKRRLKRSEYVVSRNNPATTKRNKTDNPSEFFVQSDDPGVKQKRHDDGEGDEEVEEEEKDNRKEVEIQIPSSKAWGRITEHFPSLLSDRKEEEQNNVKDTDLPIGLLSVKPEPVKLDRNLVKGSVRLLISSLHVVLQKSADNLSILDTYSSCWIKPSALNKNFSETLAKELRESVKDSLSGQSLFQEGDRADRSLLANFQILNLVPEKFNINFENDNNIIEDAVLYWRQVGKVIGKKAHLNTIVWPGGDLVASALSARTRSVFRVVTALAPPFVMEGALDEDGQCLRGVICHRVLTSDKDNLTLVFNEMDTQERKEEEVEELRRDERTEKPFKFLDHNYFEYHSTKYKYKSSCCYGLAMDLLENIAQELEFEFHLYLVPDGAYGAKNHVWEQGIPRSKWNGIVGDLVSGAAHMSFAALSVSKQRSQVIDFSTPYFFSGVSFLAAPTKKSEVPLMAFLLPFSTELWIAIFTSLNITAMAVACYEWLSPFGLNPWGRQRSRNFSIASALWVMWGLLCGHLVAFKAPKSWPNKFLINVWGGFSVIFVASYTANIAALIAGLFFHNSVSDYHDRSLLTQRVGAPKSSSADYYIHRANQHLWEHMQKYSFKDVETGISLLRNGSLDILVADTPILDYYRATDHGCKLQKIVEAINEDTYAIGMNKGFPLKESISAVISKYSNNGYMDILTEKWYGGLPCFKMMPSVELTDVGQPRPLGVAAVAGVFLLLGLGMVVGVLILIVEHLFYRYTLPKLRHQPKGTIWRSRNIMFFSQKLYRFINCVELVSPHHAARELVHTLRQGQITSLFQKSVKRKEHEQRRRRKSKAQFFEMIQEIRRVQQEEKYPKVQQNFPEATESSKLQLRGFLTSPRALKHFCSKSSVSPQKNLTEPLNPTELLQHRSSKSSSRLDIRRFSKELFSLPRSPKSPRTKSSASLESRTVSSDLDENLSRNDWKIFKSSEARLAAKDFRIQTSNAIGRRLSKDASSWLNNSPPDLNARRKSHLDVIQTKSLSVSDNLLDETSSDRVNMNTPKSLFKSNESEKEFFSKSMTLTPVISTAATMRLASSGSLDKVKAPKVRPRLPSPPKSPMIEFRNPTTPKINVSDGNTSNLYDTITPADEINKKKSNKNTHCRSKSLDNKHLRFGATVVNIGSTDEKSNKTDKQTIKYATLDHETRDKFEEDFQKSYLYEELQDIKNVNLSKNNQTNILDGKNSLEKNLVNRKEDSKKNISPLKSSKTGIDNKSKTISPSKVESLNAKKTQSLYAEPQKPKRNKKEDQAGTGKKITEKSSEHKHASKPRVPAKDNVIGFKQTRAYSAPESGQNLHSASVVFVPEKAFKTYPEYNYYSERKKFQKSDSFPERYPEVICSKHCFENFPDKRQGLFDPRPDPPPRNRSGQSRRMETSGRSRSMPEHYCLLTCDKLHSEKKLQRKTEAPIVVLQSAESLDTSSRNPGILRNRRRNKSKEELNLPPAPPSPPGRNIHRQGIKREVLFSKKPNQTYLQPP